MKKLGNIFGIIIALAVIVVVVFLGDAATGATLFSGVTAFGFLPIMRDVQPSDGGAGELTLEQKAAAISAQIDKNEAEITRLNKEAQENGEMSKKAMEAMEEHLALYKQNEEAFNALTVKQQEQLDALELKLKETPTYGAPASMKSHIQEKLEDKQSEIDEFLNGGRSKLSFDLDRKMMTKADITDSNSFTNDVIRPDLIDGVFRTPERKTHIRNFMNVTTTDSRTIDYMQETAITDNVANTAEGSAPSQSDLSLTQQEAIVRIIRSYFTVAKESLADVPYLENHIRTRGLEKLMSHEDNQILYGAGTGQNLAGLDGVVDAYTDLLADSAVNRYDILMAGAVQCMVDEYTPNLVLVHPNTYRDIALEKDGNDAYITPTLFTGAPIKVGGAVVVPNTAVKTATDDFFIGDFAMATTLVVRQDVTVTMTDSNDADFTKGLITIMIEERVGLPVYRTDAIVYGDMTTAIGGGTA